MKRLKHDFKKGMAFVLSLAMVAGLVPAMSGGANKVQAAPGSGTEPSVSAYATKDQMMDDTFAPDNTGTASNYGKLVFGKNSSGEAQEWYILGKDEGVSGDNTIIFAASPIATGWKFNSSISKKSFDSSFGVYASNPSDVYPNHYGASELRAELQSMTTDPKYFTINEEKLMNATTVKTEDMNNSNVTYTTTDKLYALQGNYNDYLKLWAGTNDSTVLAMSSYWSNGSWFWLRSPRTSDDCLALLAEPGDFVAQRHVTLEDDVQPASNLNLSSVLFASAATAASRFPVEAGTIALDKAMTLRLDGTGKNIGTVTYNATAGDIKVDTSQPVSLVVQGNDGTRDWYYSKQITGPDTVNASDIKSELVSQPYIDLSACKIWLEITDSTDNLTYAVNAAETVDSDISSVAITGIDTPTANITLDTSAICATTGVSSTTPQITWTPGDTTAGYNTSYTASITLTADTGYKFVDSTTATINGNTATSVTKNANGTLTVTYAFPATAKDSITSVASVSAYATKTQLMDTTFAPNADGTAVNYGKIVFGKKSDGTTAQEWYILGKDEGVSGDNTIIFAASPIATGQVFNSSTSNKTFASSFGVYASNPSEVYANHYGASDLRVVLQGMATNTNNFTTAEQGLMNATTVKTEDTKNSNVTYTTTDKLYALQGNYIDNSKLWAGTSDSTVLAMSSYWSNGSWFWLRSPGAMLGAGALLASPGKCVGSVIANYDFDDRAVQPASNLKLSSVLFASAATAGTSGAIGDKAMTLRLDGTGKNIGTVTYNATTGDIKVVRGDTSQPVSLVVQGNDGTKDWYYSKQIAGPETVNASDIKSALSLTSDIDLSACKIWLEITDSTENLTYAVNATETVDSDISSVAITGIDTPTANTTLDTSAACATTGVSSTTPQIAWTPGDTTAGYNTSYTASITLTADTGYKFVDSTTATINGNTATSVNKNTDGTLTVTYAFPATAKDKLTSITAPSITTQPGNATVKVSETATFTIAASGDNLTYQWQIDRNDGKGWVNIDGATATSYTTSTVNISCNGFKYKCVVSNSAGNVESNSATLTVQDAGGSDNPDTPNNTYQIIDGANSSWTHDSDGNITIRGNGDFSKFTGVKVDGNLIDKSNYTAKEGSTIITLKASYLNTLSAGTHTVEILWTDGSASTTFAIKANTSDNSNNNQNDNNNSDSSDDKPSSGTDKKDVTAPKTGDNTPIVWLFILSILSGTGLIITVKKRRENLNS